MGSAHFKSYVANLNRVRFIELLERFNLERRDRDFRASLVVNPITGLPYAPEILSDENSEG